MSYQRSYYELEFMVKSALGSEVGEVIFATD